MQIPVYRVQTISTEAQGVMRGSTNTLCISFNMQYQILVPSSFLFALQVGTWLANMKGRRKAKSVACFLFIFKMLHADTAIAAPGKKSGFSFK